MIAIMVRRPSGSKNRGYRTGIRTCRVSAYGLSRFDVSRRSASLLGPEETRIDADNAVVRLRNDTDLVVDQEVGQLRPVNQTRFACQLISRTRRASAVNVDVVISTPFVAFCPSMLPANIWTTGLPTEPSQRLA